MAAVVVTISRSNLKVVSIFVEGDQFFIVRSLTSRVVFSDLFNLVSYSLNEKKSFWKFQAFVTISLILNKYSGAL